MNGEDREPGDGECRGCRGIVFAGMLELLMCGILSGLGWLAWMVMK
jgi:hypothetical protein